MEYSFTAFGHPNILATHTTTLEFTKDEQLTKQGDCIVGIKADFSLEKIKAFIQNLESKKIEIIINTTHHTAKIHTLINPAFSSETEMVVRTTGFISARTFAIKADTAAGNLPKLLVKDLQSPTKIFIKIMSL